MIKLETLKLDLIDYNNINHLNFLKKLMKSKDINYLWDLTNRDLVDNQNKGNYIVVNETDDYIGYINFSNPTEAYYGNTVSIYYAIEASYRGREYGKKTIEEISNWLFNKNNVDCIVAQVDTKNGYSMNTLTKAGMELVLKSDEYLTFIQKKSK